MPDPARARPGLGVAPAAGPAATGHAATGPAIAGIRLRNKVVLAPMSGVSDEPFRDVALAWDVGLTVTEMVASRELVRERHDVVRRARTAKGANRQAGRAPHVVQLAGCEAHWMAEGARMAESLGADIIDINMGCPAREVTGRLAGSALMREPDHALALIEATVGAVRVPVTLKMRMGWDEHSLNAPDIARRAEAAGIAMITVHGRTRCQFFKGRADWAFIARVKAAVAIPVLANGDVGTVEEARRILDVSGADGVMVGRGAYGAPWLLGRMAAVLDGAPDPGEPPPAVQAHVVATHYEAMLSHYGRELGLKNARKHLGWYVARAVAAPERAKAWRRVLCTESDAERVRRHISHLYDEVAETAA